LIGKSVLGDMTQYLEVIKLFERETDSGTRHKIKTHPEKELTLTSRDPIFNMPDLTETDSQNDEKTSVKPQKSVILSN
jgi:hypothetical protein